MIIENNKKDKKLTNQSFIKRIYNNKNNRKERFLSKSFLNKVFQFYLNRITLTPLKRNKKNK